MKHKLIISSYDDIGNPYYAGGGAMAVHKVAENLNDKFDITVITAKYPGSTDGKVDNVDYKRIGISFVGPKLGQLVFQLLLPFYARKLKYDLWMESFTPPFSTAFLPLFTKKPVIGLVHMLAAADMERKYKLPFHIIENFGLRKYQNFIVTSNQYKEKISKINRDANISIIPVGIDIPRKIKLENNDKYILFLGRIEVDQKGIDLLLKSYKLIESKITHKLLIAGAGTVQEENKLKSKIRSMKLQDRVVVYGRVSGIEKENLFRKAEVVAIPSRYETFGVVALEAMSYEIPTIGYDIEGFKWTGDAILKVETFNYQKFSTELLKLIKDKDLKNKFIKSGNQMLVNYAWDSIFTKYRNLILDILDTERIKRKDVVLNYIIRNKIHCYFVSPHLDDAAFSAGYLLSYLAKHTKVTILNTFTSPGHLPYTFSAKSFLKQTNYRSVNQLVEDRIGEDSQILKKHNIEVVNLGYEDALWRKKPTLGKIAKVLSRILPEFIHVYPTYRFHITKGRISSDDYFVYEKLRNQLKTIIKPEDIVFCPLGYGQHVDHIIVREACRSAFEKVIYWSDFPYCLKSDLKNDFVKRDYLSRFSFESSRRDKKDLILGYKSQIPAIFGETKVPIIREKYYTHPFLFKQNDKKN